MMIQEVKELRDLNVELLEDILSTFRSIDDYCHLHNIPVPFDAEMQERVNKALSVIAKINGKMDSPTNSDTYFRHPHNPTVYIIVHAILSRANVRTKSGEAQPRGDRRSSKSGRRVA